ncbi:hypothetical protein BT96DRAFT_934317 [Gymnopus androsaceus JB14]|uniref:Uncharacterized protein n=1 Tax=Gymnopus androsaceus JB14 TaxID=1447944 RepID=A0A6A4I8M1_9AGAR|nr:hypothetical protein BT96DRAFT_934317 [Gymnopus androsaceus JB14]
MAYHNSNNYDSGYPTLERHYNNIYNPPLDSYGARAYRIHCADTDFENYQDLPYTILPNSPPVDLHENMDRALPPLPPTPKPDDQDTWKDLPAVGDLGKDSTHVVQVASPVTGKENKEKGDMKEKKGRRPGTKLWQGRDLIDVARAMVDHTPFLQSYGKKGKIWAEIYTALLVDGFHLTDITPLALQHKAENLIGYWKDPDSNNPGIKAVAKKQEEDTAGGEEIRKASMRSLRQRNDQTNADVDDSDCNNTDTNIDTEPEDNTNDTKVSVHKRKLTASSASSIDDDNKPCKRQRSSVRRTGSQNTNEILLFLKDDSKDRKAH